VLIGVIDVDEVLISATRYSSMVIIVNHGGPLVEEAICF
jgi:hypothetical protein